jgi:uncharacterized protein (DUF305 family)
VNGSPFLPRRRRQVRPARDRPRAVRTVLEGTAVAALLAACGAEPAATASATTDPLIGQVCCVVPSHGAAEMVDGIETAHNGWDNTLVSWLAPHDAVASQMADMAATQAGSAQVRDLAAGLDAQTAPRYLQLSAMAGAWSQPIPSTDPADAAGHDHGGGVTEADTAATLIPLTGAEFDHEYLKIMIGHHEAAVVIAENTIANGENDQAKALAQALLDTQAPELTTMQALLIEVS